ncbi:ABC transporter permease [Halorussus halobius]|uniref:ABC transporter permease n=1 Tax=Halorussus halobius TaxID=1710537 RepID=UPI001FCECC34|nr:ABC transporter permease [Halorussus halobius]
MSAPTRSTGVEAGPVGYLKFFLASLRKRVLLMVRYPVNFLTDIAQFLLLFLAVFYGGRAIAPAAISDTIEGIIVGFLLWTLALSGFSGLSWNVTRESQWGTLEQLFMSPYGFGRVMFAKTVVNVLVSFLWGAITLAFMMAVSGRWLALDPLTVLPLSVLALAPALGVGFALGGLAIRFKRIENVFQVMQFAFVGLIAAPVGQYPLLKWLPLAQGSQLLQTAMRDGVRLWALPTDELGVLVVTGVGYLALGYVVFGYCQRWARREGVMGHY